MPAKRRADYEGTLEQLKSGKFRYRAWVDGSRVSGSAKDTQREALADFRRKLSAARNPKPKPKKAAPTVADYAYSVIDGPYRERVATGDMSDGTWSLYEQIQRLNLEGDPLGAMPIDEVTHEHVEEWIRNLKTQPRIDKAGKITHPARPLHPNSKARYAGFLSGIFTRARMAKLIENNPVRDAEKPSFEETDFRILTQDEIEELLKVVRAWELASYETEERETFFANAGLHEAIKTRLTLATLLGLHGFGPAEMCGLRKEDFEDGGLELRFQAKRGKITSRLKTRQRKGWVAVDDDLAAMIEDAPPGLLLANKSGGAMRTENLRRSFQAAVKGTAFDGLNLYDLRHTFAMRLLEEGTDVRTVAELMRNSPEVVLKRYARSRDELKRKAVAKLRRRTGAPTHPTTHEAKSA